jgi:regulatory protein
MSLSKEKKYLLYLLAKQDYSRKQLSEKLRDRNNISVEEIGILLDEFEASNWLSDERFVETFVRGEISKLRGRKRIINIAVYQKGLSQELVERCIDYLGINWVELCKNCLEKKYKNLDALHQDLKLKNKVINYLVYNGFGYDEINTVIDN